VPSWLGVRKAFQVQLTQRLHQRADAFRAHHLVS
jgi:hypothetical protein